MYLNIIVQSVLLKRGIIMETTKEKTCENCRFYKKHYIKTSSGYSATGCGHCCNGKTHFINKTKIRENCEYWQPAELQKTELEEKLIDKLKSLVKRLDAVCKVLIDDND